MISDEQKQLLIKDFTEYITNERMSSNKINYTKTLTNIINKDVPKPVVQIMPEAYLKMLTLVDSLKTEVAWHGTVIRQENVFTILDILVYPQVVSSVTASSLPVAAEYDHWLMTQPDEIFNLIRFQGHSHVNMGTSPSGTDEQFYNAILQTLRKGDYYIFAIMNKRSDINIWIYDYKENMIYEKNDIAIDILLTDGTPLNSWFKKNDNLIQEPKATYMQTSVLPQTQIRTRNKQLYEIERERQGWYPGGYQEGYPFTYEDYFPNNRSGKSEKTKVKGASEK